MKKDKKCKKIIRVNAGCRTGAWRVVGDEPSSSSSLGRRAGRGGRRAGRSGRRGAPGRAGQGAAGAQGQGMGRGGQGHTKER
jgi:hypothetical protein